MSLSRERIQALSIDEKQYNSLQDSKKQLSLLMEELGDFSAETSSFKKSLNIEDAKEYDGAKFKEFLQEENFSHSEKIFSPTRAIAEVASQMTEIREMVADLKDSIKSFETSLEKVNSIDTEFKKLKSDCVSGLKKALLTEYQNIKDDFDHANESAPLPQEMEADEDDKNEIENSRNEFNKKFAGIANITEKFTLELKEQKIDSSLPLSEFLKFFKQFHAPARYELTTILNSRLIFLADNSANFAEHEITLEKIAAKDFNPSKLSSQLTDLRPDSSISKIQKKLALVQALFANLKQHVTRRKEILTTEKQTEDLRLENERKQEQERRALAEAETRKQKETENINARNSIFIMIRSLSELGYASVGKDVKGTPDEKTLTDILKTIKNDTSPTPSSNTLNGKLVAAVRTTLKDIQLDETSIVDIYSKLTEQWENAQFSELEQLKQNTMLDNIFKKILSSAIPAGLIDAKISEQSPTPEDVVNYLKIIQEKSRDNRFKELDLAHFSGIQKDPSLNIAAMWFVTLKNIDFQNKPPHEVLADINTNLDIAWEAAFPEDIEQDEKFSHERDRRQTLSNIAELFKDLFEKNKEFFPNSVSRSLLSASHNPLELAQKIIQCTKGGSTNSEERLKQIQQLLLPRIKKIHKTDAINLSSILKPLHPSDQYFSAIFFAVQQLPHPHVIKKLDNALDEIKQQAAIEKIKTLLKENKTPLNLKIMEYLKKNKDNTSGERLAYIRDILMPEVEKVFKKKLLGDADLKSSAFDPTLTAIFYAVQIPSNRSLFKLEQALQKVKTKQESLTPRH